MFYTLIVDDNEADAWLIRELMNRRLRRRHQEYIVNNGSEALDFLYRRNPYQHACRPDLILLDLNMPKLPGIEALQAIKNDPELSVIPVIVLSASNYPEDVRRCYRAHANGYVRKPNSLERSEELVRAIDAFWVDFAVLPSDADFRAAA